MTERDGPAVLVDDFLVHAEFAQGLGGNGGEGFVDLYGRQVCRAGLDFFSGLQRWHCPVACGAARQAPLRRRGLCRLLLNARYPRYKGEKCLTNPALYLPNPALYLLTGLVIHALQLGFTDGVQRSAFDSDGLHDIVGTQ